ncbi:GTP cyclohydrolase FolE2 [Sorangium sp. So ce1153]|uniref:GTP cyclohydrolase FolE2 n=1 Tax=Sorangium sp. So ce1153 TaxID=3133333 RepID=UPI003F63C56D
MEDVQGRRDARGIPINQAGVSDLAYPIVVLDRAHERQHTIAKISMSVGLPHDFKGTHMSRFIEVLEEHRGEVTVRTLPRILRALRERLHAETAQVKVVFPYFLERRAPVSGACGLIDYECSLTGETSGTSEDFVLGVRVPVTTLCPCSKAISDYGAHNQRTYVTIEVRGTSPTPDPSNFIWIEELVEVAEASASAPVYPLLKRPDERHVTMQAYDNPAFVEDVVRDVALKLQEDPRVAWFRVHAKSDESIHNHSAFAQVEQARSGRQEPPQRPLGGGSGSGVAPRHFL